MSLTAVRDELAAALDAVAGVTAGSGTMPVLDVGVAMPVLASMAAQGVPGIFEVTWSVRVITGRTAQDAIPFLDAHLGDILEALRPHGYVESVEPAVFTTPAGDLHGVTIRLTREQ